MKKALILSLALLFCLSSCGTMQTTSEENPSEVESEIQTALSPETPIENSSKEVQTESPSAEVPTAASESEETPISEMTHKELLQMIYDNYPMITQLTMTDDFAQELFKMILATRPENWSPDKAGSEYSDYYLGINEEDWIPKFRRIDPFSEKMLPDDTVQKIEAGTYYGELLEKYGFPNYNYFWSVVPEDYPEDKLKSDWYPYPWEDWNMEMHSFWFLENGNILQVILDGILELNHFIAPGTSAPYYGTTTVRDRWFNLSVRECKEISPQDFFGLYEYYLSLERDLPIGCTSFFGQNRWDPRDLGGFWSNPRWPWPEIFVTKYGME